VFHSLRLRHKGERAECSRATTFARHQVICVASSSPEVLPALARADKLQRRAATVGFDWDEVAPVLEKVQEEIAELSRAIGDSAETRAELGDVLFAVANLGRHLGVDPELALRQANTRFGARFRAMEEAAAASGVSLGELSLAQLEELWEAAKAAEGR